MVSEMNMGSTIALFFDVFGRFIVEAEVNFRVEHARHVVDVLAADG